MWILLSLLGAPSWAADEPPTDAMVNGSPTADYPEVVALGLRDTRTGEVYASFCSGTLIAPTWVLTAAHCTGFRDANLDRAPTAEAVIVFGPDVTAEGARVVGFKRWIDHPDYENSIVDEMPNDIALIELAEPVRVVPPAVLEPDAFVSTWEGIELEHVGYGVTGDGEQDAGTKQLGVIDYWQSNEAKHFSLETTTNLCSGDSGGPAFRQTDWGRKVVGVASFVFSYHVEGKNCEGGGTATERVDTQLAFIEQYVPEVATRFEGEPADPAPPDTGAADDTGDGLDDPGVVAQPIDTADESAGGFPIACAASPAGSWPAGLGVAGALAMAGLLVGRRRG